MEWINSYATSELMRPRDYEFVQGMVEETIVGSADIPRTMASIRLEQQAIDSEMYEQLECVGLYLVSADDNSPAVIPREYLYGMELALHSIDVLCRRFGIDEEKFRRVWKTTGYVKIIDRSAAQFAGMTADEVVAEVGDGIKALGHRTIDQLGESYDEVIAGVAAGLGMDHDSSRLLRASYGYVLNGGLNAMQRLLGELRARELTSGIDIEQELSGILKDHRIDRTSAVCTTDHVAVADRLYNDLFEGSEAPADVLEDVTARLIRTSPELIRMLKSVSMEVFPPGHAHDASEDAEAFFYGGIVGATIVQQIAADHSLGDAAWIGTWRGQYAHASIGGARNSNEEPRGITEWLNKVLDRPPLHEYGYILERLAMALDCDAEEAIALVSGMHYVVTTGGDAVKAARKGYVASVVAAETQNLDTVIARLLEK